MEGVDELVETLEEVVETVAEGVNAGVVVTAGDPVEELDAVDEGVVEDDAPNDKLADGDVVGDDDGEKYGAIRGSACSSVTVLYDLVASAHFSATPLLIVGSTRGSDSSARTVAVQSKYDAQVIML